MSLTFFAAALRCPVCGTVSAADSSTNMVNHFAPEPETVIRVGDYPNAGIGDMELVFLKAKEPRDGDDVLILQDWACPTCGASNWAEVIFHGRRVASIENVPLSRETLGRAHFVVDNLYKSYEAITGHSMYVDNEVRPDFVAFLANHLPES